MNEYQKKALIRFCCSLACLVMGVLLGAWGSLGACFLFLDIASLLLWRGWNVRAEGLRIKKESEWWINAKNGVEQEALDPCCVTYGETLFRHDDASCTRRRYPIPRVISAEELAEIDRVWAEMIAHMNDPESEEGT